MTEADDGGREVVLADQEGRLRCPPSCPPVEEHTKGARDIAAIEFIPKDPLENKKVPVDDSRPELFDEDCEDTPEKWVRVGACVLPSV